MLQNNHIPSVSHGGANIMVWANCAASGPGWLGNINSTIDVLFIIPVNSKGKVRTSIHKLNLKRKSCSKTIENASHFTKERRIKLINASK